MSVKTSTECFVSIQDANDKEIFRFEALSVKDAVAFYDQYRETIPEFGIHKAIWVPVRTDRWDSFVNDFFCPVYSFINETVKTDNYILKNICIILAVIIDIVTFPVRLISAPFRAAYNYYHPITHPLDTLFKDNPQALEVVARGVVKIEIAARMSVEKNNEYGEASSSMNKCEGRKIATREFANFDWAVWESAGSSHLTKA